MSTNCPILSLSSLPKVFEPLLMQCWIFACGVPTEKHPYFHTDVFFKTWHEVVVIRYVGALSLSLNFAVDLNDPDIANMLGRKCLFRAINLSLLVMMNKTTGMWTFCGGGERWGVCCRNWKESTSFFSSWLGSCNHLSWKQDREGS